MYHILQHYLVIIQECIISRQQAYQEEMQEIMRASKEEIQNIVEKNLRGRTKIVSPRGKGTKKWIHNCIE